jgi:hypothetical protein
MKRIITIVGLAISINLLPLFVVGSETPDGYKTPETNLTFLQSFPSGISGNVSPGNWVTNHKGDLAMSVGWDTGYPGPYHAYFRKAGSDKIIRKIRLPFPALSGTFTPDDKFIVLYYDHVTGTGTPYTLDLATGAPIKRYCWDLGVNQNNPFKLHKALGRAGNFISSGISFSKDGSKIYLGSGANLLVEDVQTCAVTQRIFTDYNVLLILPGSSVNPFYKLTDDDVVAFTSNEYENLWANAYVRFHRDHESCGFQGSLQTRIADCNETEENEKGIQYKLVGSSTADDYGYRNNLWLDTSTRKLWTTPYIWDPRPRVPYHLPNDPYRTYYMDLSRDRGNYPDAAQACKDMAVHFNFSDGLSSYKMSIPSYDEFIEEQLKGWRAKTFFLATSWTTDLPPAVWKDWDRGIPPSYIYNDPRCNTQNYRIVAEHSSLAPDHPSASIVQASLDPNCRLAETGNTMLLSQTPVQCVGSDK